MGKKTVLMVAVALMAIPPLLFACGGGTPEPAPTPAPAPSPAPAVALAIPHPLDGRDACLTCHETGVGDAKVMPVDHAGRTDNLCQTCHHPAG